MTAVTRNEHGAQPAHRDDPPAPIPGAREVLVREHASSVNPVDDGIPAGMVKNIVPHDFPITLGHDLGGVVQPVGDGVTGVSAGDEVSGFMPATAPTTHAGAWAEPIAVPEAAISREPDGVTQICRTVLPRRAVRASVGSSGAVGGGSDCTDSLTSRGRVRPLLGVTFKFSHSKG